MALHCKLLIVRRCGGTGETNRSDLFRWETVQIDNWRMFREGERRDARTISIYSSFQFQISHTTPSDYSFWLSDTHPLPPHNNNIFHRSVHNTDLPLVLHLLSDSHWRSLPITYLHFCTPEFRFRFTFRSIVVVVVEHCWNASTFNYITNWHRRQTIDCRHDTWESEENKILFSQHGERHTPFALVFDDGFHDDSTSDTLTNSKSNQQKEQQQCSVE